MEAIIGRVAFLQSPNKPGDDNGVDVLGFFKADHPRRPDMQIPSLPFHMQVKPKNEPSFISKHIHELTQLHAPFYFAIGDTDEFTVEIYSGLGLVGLCMIDDRHELCRRIDLGELKVLLKLTENPGDSAGLPRWVEDNTLEIDFYKVAVLDTKTKIDSKDVQRWRRDCAAIARSIESYNSGEFVLDCPEGTVAQAIGIGTYTHAVKRMMHASAMLSEVIHHGNSFAGGIDVEDAEFLVVMGRVAEYLNGLRGRILDPTILLKLVTEERWVAWYRNVSAIARLRQQELNNQHSQDES
ncbi:MAG: hypothetical protein IPF79_14880 [Ignavibacteria bacterium]|nr:hypothetical protein [Ignavibacteria bacterium]